MAEIVFSLIKINNPEEIQNEAKIHAYPIANPKLTVKILDLLNQSMHYKQLKKGINESIKVLNKGFYFY